ncbi:hypothetical protein [Bernardetia sp.]|uniref:hypothetical protein n=1 Tax=Bernardetia sp. TaxID=1937974 RepID=UPI0025B7F600|nr:hypothetical protein [Bernardetia sp.]
MHIHKIDSQIHSEFLKEERQDPITGDLIEEGDEVVFCASCKSAFLKDTWEYLGKKHCHQRRTLKHPTFGKSLVLVKAKQQTVFFPLEGAKSFKKFRKLTKNSSWKSQYEKIENNVIVHNEKEGTGLILLLAIFVYVFIMTTFGVSAGFFGIISSPVLLVLARYYINLVYSSNTDKAMLGIGESELIIYFSERRQKATIHYNQVEKIIITYQSEDKSKVDIKDWKDGIAQAEIKTMHVKQLISSISKCNKKTLVELVSFPDNYQDHNFFWHLQENPLLRLV